MFMHLQLVCGCFQAAIAELSNYNNIPVAHQPKLFLAGPLQNKFADPDQGSSLRFLVC